MKTLLAALAVTLLLTGCTERTPESRTATYCDDTFSHDLKAKAFVKRKLRNPDSAQFGFSKTDYLGECKHVTTGYVTAQNGFGGMKQSTYVAVTRWSHEEQTFMLTDIRIE